MKTLQQTIDSSVLSALKEDIGDGDITAGLITDSTQLEVNLLCREQAILCGQKWFDQSFLLLDEKIQINWLAKDGDLLQGDQIICQLRGNARPLLSAERTALNFLQTLSGTATATHYYQNLIAQTDCRILDTRKTIPNLRQEQKYAVRCGGGLNHRIGLFDAYLLKENHLAACGSMSSAVEQARRLNPDVLLEVEVEDLDQLQQAIDNRVDRVLLDNFSIGMLQQAVILNNSAVKLEASGNITEDNILQVAQTGVDYISIGAITKHVRAVDFSLRFID